MLESLKEAVCKANLDLVSQGVVRYTWGNVSGIDREAGLMVIKPSGVSYDNMKPSDMVVVDLDSGTVVEGDYRPSSDTDTHLVLYREFSAIGGVTHTHSIHAVAYAQAGMDVPALGTTHADNFYGDIPCTRQLTQQEVEKAYEHYTGTVIVEEFSKRSLDPMAVPAVVVRGHGPFAWGADPASAVCNAVVLEDVAHMNLFTMQINPQARLAQYVLDKHYLRKHGPNAYYGQA